MILYPLKFLDRHPMAVSRFHPGRFVTVFGEAILEKKMKRKKH